MDNDPIRALSEKVKESSEIIFQSHLKIGVAARLFRAQSHEDDDEISFYLGLESISNELINDLCDVVNEFRRLCENLEMCTLDPAKVEERRQYLKSVGLRDNTRLFFEKN